MVNSVTTKISYYLPRIDDTINMIASKIFFALDLRRGYCWVELDEEKRIAMKCSFFKKKVRYLGNIVLVIQVDDRRTKTINDWSISNRNMLTTLFILSFAQIDKQLMKLTVENRTFVWNQECPAAINNFQIVLKNIANTVIS